MVQKKTHKVLHTTTFEPFAVELCWSHQNALEAVTRHQATTDEDRLLIIRTEKGWKVDTTIAEFQRDSGNGVCCLISREVPGTSKSPRHIVRETCISRSSVARIVKKDLQLSVFRRCEVHSRNNKRCYWSNDWCCYSFSWWACWASPPLTLWRRACCKPYFFYGLPWNCRWYWCFHTRLLNKEYLKARSEFYLFSCYVLIYEHFGENRGTLRRTIAMFDAINFVWFFWTTLYFTTIKTNNSSWLH